MGILPNVFYRGVWPTLGRRLLTLLFLACYTAFVPYAYAGPAGGQIVGGAGNIQQAGLNTVINQSSALLAIDWNSFNLSSDERVSYIQPGIASIALNRILDQNASQIHGRIDANGHIVLVNPNGIFFGQNASLNVGGLIASGLDIDPAEFMNGNYLFSAIEDTDGKVVNSGMINASLGGSVTLLGKQVHNEGLIVANLGAVNMAAGKEAVLTFDNAGLVGVRVTEAVLQDELGVDPAVLNNGQISAQGGRILMTGSVSREIFSSAVNTGDMQQATSVVVHEDGSFTLGAGADVVNNGELDVSAADNVDAGQVVLLGENVSSSGAINADADQADGGNIELHANDTVLLTGDSVTSARSEGGAGGNIKVLANNAGLFDQAVVDVSGATGGGEALIGGDYLGENLNIRNAEFTYIGEQARVYADALGLGNGGRVIAWADNTTRVYGGIYARGGLQGGNGGFIETSGKLSLNVTHAPDVSAVAGIGGEWLLDPSNVTVVDNCAPGPACIDAGVSPFSPSVDNTEIEDDIIETALQAGDVTINTANVGGLEAGNITVSAAIRYSEGGGAANSSTLTLDADNAIFINNTIDVGTNDSLSVNLYANAGVTIQNSGNIITGGGDFTVGGAGGNTPTFFEQGAAAGSIDAGAGAISITTDGNNGGIPPSGANLGRITTTGDFTLVSTGGAVTQSAVAFRRLSVGGAVTIDAGANDITLTNNSNDLGTSIRITNGMDVTLVDINGIIIGDAAGASNIAGDFSVNALGGSIQDQLQGVTVNGLTIFNANGNNIFLDNANDFIGNVRIVSANDVTLNDINNIALADVSGGVNVTGTFSVTADGTIDDGAAGALSIGGAATFDANGNAITLDNANDFNGGVRVISAGSVVLNDTDTIQLGLGAGVTNIGGTLDVTAGGPITDGGVLNVTGNSAFDAGGNAITLDNANNFTGGVRIISAGDVVLNDVNDIVLGSIFGVSNIGGTLNVTANGAITDGGVLNVTGIGDSGFNANGNAITLNNANDFVGGVRIISASDVDLTDINDIVLGAASGDSNIGGTLNVTANGTITDGGVLNVTGAGDSGFNANGNAITLNEANNFVGGVRIVSASDVILNDINDIVLGTASGASNIGGTLNVTANGTITDGGVLNVTGIGNSGFNANGNAITLDNANDFVGPVRIISASDVVLNDINNIVLGAASGASNIGGALDVTTNGFITDGGALNVGGVATLNSNGSIIILDAAHDFNAGVRIVNAGTTILNDVNDIVLGSAAGASTIAGSLFVTSDGQITDAGVLNIAGNSDFDANGNAITLNNANDFTGSVLIDSASDVILNDSNSIILGSALDVSNITGTLTVTSNGSITDSGTLLIGGISSFNAGANTNAVTLDDASNDFGAAVGIVNAGNVTLVDTNNIQLGSFNIGGNLNVTAGLGSDITQIDVPVVVDGLIVGGLSTFNVSAGRSITLGNTDNNFNGISFGITALDNVTVSNIGALDLQALNLTGDLVINTQGAITNSGALTVLGDTRLNAGAANNITLTNGLNDFDDIVIVAGNNVSITDVNSINIGDGASDSLISGNLTINADSISNTDANRLQVNGIATLGAGTGTIILDGPNIDLNSVRVNGSSTVIIEDQNTIDLGVSTITGAGTFNVTAGGNITNNGGALSIAGAAGFTATDGDTVVLNNAGNQLGGALSFASAGPGMLSDVTIVNSAPTDIGALNITGNLTVTSGGALTDSANISVGGATTISAAGQDVTLNNNNDFNTVTVSAANNVTLVDANQLTVAGINAAGGSAVVFANGNLDIGGVTALNDIQLFSQNGSILQNTGLSTSQGNILADANQVITMAGGSSSSAATGNIQYLAGGNVLTTSLTAINGTAGITSTNGQIIDANGGSANLTAPRVELSANTGIGAGDAIEIQTARLFAVNGSGNVGIDNTGAVTLEALRNTGDINFNNDLDITFIPGSVDAGFNTGALFMTTLSGSFIGEPPTPDFSNPDITAREADFVGLAGNFGAFDRPLVLRIRDRAGITTLASFNPQFAPPRPEVEDNSNFTFVATDAILAITGEQLVEVETLGEIDPAIFTDVRNYATDEIAIRLPRDQLYEDELEAFGQ